MKDEVLKEKDLANSNLQVDNHQLNNVVISLRTKTEQQQKENEEIEKKSGEHERQISKLKEDKIQACRQINEMKTERTTMQILLVLLLAVLVGGFAVWFSHFHSSDTGKEVLQSVMDKLHTEHKQHLEKSKAGLAEVAASTGGMKYSLNMPIVCSLALLFFFHLFFANITDTNPSYST